LLGTSANGYQDAAEHYYCKHCHYYVAAYSSAALLDFAPEGSQLDWFVVDYFTCSVVDRLYSYIFDVSTHCFLEQDAALACVWY